MQLESHIASKKRAGFDPHYRASEAVIARELKTIAKSPVMNAVLDAAGWDMLVLNRQLQVVVSNSRAQHGRDASNPVPVGPRLGEVYACVNAIKSHKGCGSDPDCTYCGALNVILSSLEKGRSVTGECLMRTKTSSGTGAGEYNVTATPIDMGDKRFVVVALNNISAQKRHALIERIFVHDLKNALTGLIGWSDLLAEAPLDNTETTASRISALARNIAEEIEAHRLLTAAESGLLQATFQDVSVVEILMPLKFLFSRHELAYAKHIVIPDPIPNRAVRTDPAVLRRVLVNMMTNALEATIRNGVIRVDFIEDEHGVAFTVWNDGVIPKEVAAHIFKRSFSTKTSAGHGLGTYSMKIFGEDVLKGEVSFTSEAGLGTMFRIFLPKA
jgi:hypothetical protein